MGGGYLGLGDHDPKNAYDIERERRAREKRQQSKSEIYDNMEKRSWEKVQEILQDQQDPPESKADADGTRVIVKDKDRRLKVADIMSGKVATVKFDDTVMTVKGIFSRVRFHHLPVVDEEQHVIGIISDRDFLAAMSPFAGTVNEQNRDLEILKRKVGLIMTRNPSTIHMKDDVVDAIRMMNSYRVSCLPVVDQKTKQLLGIITWKDIVRAFCPEGFNHPRDSARLKTGVNIRPQTTDSGRFLPADSGRFESQGRESAGRQPPSPPPPPAPPRKAPE